LGICVCHQLARIDATFIVLKALYFGLSSDGECLLRGWTPVALDAWVGPIAADKRAAAKIRFPRSSAPWPTVTYRPTSPESRLTQAQNHGSDAEIYNLSKPL